MGSTSVSTEQNDHSGQKIISNRAEKKSSYPLQKSASSPLQRLQNYVQCWLTLETYPKTYDLLQLGLISPFLLPPALQ